MTDIAIASTALKDREAGEDLAAQLRDDLGGAPPDALIVFASAENDYESVLRALDGRVGARTMVGCSSAGEFTSDTAGTGRTTAVALRARDMRFNASVARGLSESREGAARQLADGFPRFGTLRRLQLVRPDRAGGGSVQRLPQLHGSRVRLSRLAATIGC